jgi:hypothetical protein
MIGRVCCDSQLGEPAAQVKCSNLFDKDASADTVEPGSWGGI